MKPAERVDSEFFDGFAWAVPTAFSDALATCRFEQGDTLYDTRRACEGSWGEALPYIKYSLQVKSPRRSVGNRAKMGQQAGESKGERDSSFRDNWRLPVVFSVTDYAAKKTREITATQGHLYSFLWKGDFRHIAGGVAIPQAPTLALKLLPDLAKAIGSFKGNVLKERPGTVVFLLPYDRTCQLLTAKFRRIRDSLGSLNTQISLVPPLRAGLPSAARFVPTASIACFRIQGDSLNMVEDSIKRALYGSATRTMHGKGRFRISAHGCLFVV
jgi:hypothetical protein